MVEICDHWKSDWCEIVRCCVLLLRSSDPSLIPPESESRSIVSNSTRSAENTVSLKCNTGAAIDRIWESTWRSRCRLSRIFLSLGTHQTIVLLDQPSHKTNDNNTLAIKLKAAEWLLNQRPFAPLLWCHPYQSMTAMKVKLLTVTTHRSALKCIPIIIQCASSNIPSANPR